MAEIKKYLHTLDIGNNKIINLLLNPLTTADRTTVGGTLGIADQGYVCYDTTLNVQYFWDGSNWIASGGGTGTVTGVTATSPITSSGGTAPVISTSMATNKLIGRSTTGVGVMEEITVGTGLSLSAGTLSTTGGGTVTSVGLTMPSAFSVASSPVTTSGTIAVTGAGTVSQYVRGDGTLANFPNSTGGGASVNYYLNGSIPQGTFGGDTYYQMSKTPVLGAGTNFTRTNGAGNGYIASFITDATDPSQLNIPGGNWNLEFYFASSSTGGSPQFYGEIYKVSATNVFTLVASGSANPEGITNGTTVDQYFTSISVPATTLLITDRIAVRIYVITSGRTITLHTENGNLCEVLTTFTTGLTALNGLTDQVQYFATGNTGTSPNWSSVSPNHTLNIPLASTASVTAGLISKTDYDNFTTAYTDRLKWDGGATGLVAATGRTSLGLGTAALVADNTLVHLAGTETITGVKTFNPSVSGANSTGLLLTPTNTVTANGQLHYGLRVSQTISNSGFTEQSRPLDVSVGNAQLIFTNASSLTTYTSTNNEVNLIINRTGSSGLSSLLFQNSPANNNFFAGIRANYGTGAIQFGGLSTGGYFPSFMVNNAEAGRFSTNNNLLVGTTTDAAAADKIQANGNLNLITAGNKIKIATGTNASVGTATFISGTVTLGNTCITSTSRVFCTYVTPIGTLASGFQQGTTLSSSMVINSITTAGVVNVLDNSVFQYWIIN